ncbi:MAG: type I-E CRISPR-associated protein Cse1/CasA [Thermomicrobiales bacterium]|nr:type I-E CRISPR-associated protein Cse1/CasA [Thermomicrobiales bacterium]
MASFNLVDAPWIPCVRKKGTNSEIELLGLRDVLAHSEELQEIYDPSPLVTGSLHRLLLAILHRSLNGPADQEAWVDLWQSGSFSKWPKIEAYLDEWKERFDLFHPTHPFYQTPGITTKDPWRSAKLLPELDASAFDNTLRGENHGISEAAAARALVAMQAFALGGLVSFDNPNDRSADGAPLANSALVLLRGTSLFETLMLNLARYDHANGFPFDSYDDDQPAWERDEPTTARDRLRPAGCADWLTWQSRRLLLSEPEMIDGRWVVKSVVLMKGEQLKDPSTRIGYEQMVAFRPNKGAKQGEPAHLPVRFDTNRALWRDFTSLCQMSSARGVARPQTASWIAEIAESHEDMVPGVLQADVLGMLSDRALKILWRAERFDLPIDYLTDPELTADLADALEFANIRVGFLFTAGSRTGRDGTTYQRPLQLLAERLLPSPGETVDKATVANLIESLGMERRFWPRLEGPFRELIVELVHPPEKYGNPDNPDLDDARVRRLGQWAEHVRKTAQRVFDESVAALGRESETLRAVAPAQDRFNSQLNWVTRRYIKSLGIEEKKEEEAA